MRHDEHLKVGELARRSGVSIRTLHHYDAIGLLRPAVGGAGEHRLYGRAEVARLARIRSLQALGLSLAEVASCLDDRGFEPARVIDLHLERLKDELDEARALRDRLEAIARSLRAADEPSTELLFETLDATRELEELIERHYTPEQRALLRDRADSVGSDAIERAQREWRELFDAFRTAKEAGEAPDAETVRPLAQRARELVEAFTGGDPGVRESLGRMYAENPELPRRWGVDRELWQFVQAAQAALDP